METFSKTYYPFILSKLTSAVVELRDKMQVAGNLIHIRCTITFHNWNIQEINMSYNMILLRFQIQYMVYLSHMILFLPSVLPIDLIIPEEKHSSLPTILCWYNTYPILSKHGLQNKNWHFWSLILNQLEAFFIHRRFILDIHRTTYFCN